MRESSKSLSLYWGSRPNLTYEWTPGNVHNLEYSALVVAATIFEWRFGLLRRLKNYTGDFFGRPIHTLSLFSAAVLVWFPLSLLLFVKFDENLLLLRTFNIGNTFGTGHWFTWVIIAAIAIRWGYNNFVNGFITSGMFSALHEYFWYLFYGIVYTGQIEVAFLYYVPFFILGAALTFSYFVLSHDWKDKDGKITHARSIEPLSREQFLSMIASFIVFDSLWLLMGFPVTVNLTTGGTSDFLNLPVNGIEDMSWVLPGLPLLTPKDNGKPKVKSK